MRDLSYYIAKITDPNEEEAYFFADRIGQLGTPEALQAMVDLLHQEDEALQYLAARALSGMEDNAAALEPLMTLILAPENKQRNGALVEALEGFDLSEHFVEVVRIYLFGNFKASRLAKNYLDYTDFSISPRMIKKAKKHLSHFLNNSNQTLADEAEKAAEVGAIIAELEDMFRAD
ncbi:MAG: HEAT repeat domain-containing protein [Nitritalea sp.]